MLLLMVGLCGLTYHLAPWQVRNTTCHRFCFHCLLLALPDTKFADQDRLNRCDATSQWELRQTHQWLTAASVSTKTTNIKEGHLVAEWLRCMPYNRALCCMLHSSLFQYKKWDAGLQEDNKKGESHTVISTLFYLNFNYPFSCSQKGFLVRSECQAPYTRSKWGKHTKWNFSTFLNDSKFCLSKP